MSRLSVVIPVYNVEACLDDCLGSLLAQTLEDIEIVCVDDGSTDGSRARLAEWARRDSRIVVIEKSNGGVSSARNAGLDAARSPFVCFLDADDRLLPHACEEIVRLLSESSADVATFGARCEPSDLAPEWMRRALCGREGLFEGFCPDLLFADDATPFIWQSACRMDFLNAYRIRFDERLNFGEDRAFYFALYSRAARTLLTTEELYEYRIDRVDSAMNSMRDSAFSKLSKHVDVLYSIFEDWESLGLVSRYPVELVTFAITFALYGALKLPDEQYRSIAGRVRSLLERTWSKEDVQAMSLDRMIKHLALRACYSDNASSFARKCMIVACVLSRSNLSDTLKRLKRGAA